jgi:hypothetical protein
VRRNTDLVANEVRGLIFVLLEWNGVLPDVSGAIVGLTGTLELGDDLAGLLFLCEVLVECEGAVVLFRLPLASPAGLLSPFGRSTSTGNGGGRLVLGHSGDGRSPGIVGGWGNGIAPGIVDEGGAPGVIGCGFGCSVDGGCFFDFKLCVAVVSAPGLVHFFVRVARRGCVVRDGRKGKRRYVRFTGAAVPVVLTASACTTGSTTASSPSAATIAVGVIWEL